MYTPDIVQWYAYTKINGNYKWIINKCSHGHILQQAEKTVNYQSFRVYKMILLVVYQTSYKSTFCGMITKNKTNEIFT